MSDAQAGFGHLGGSWKQHEKQTKRDKRILHGKQGQGRFRAFALCERAEWDSVYLANGSLKQFRVIGTSDNKRQFTITDEKPSKLDGTGTTATLSNLIQQQASLDSDRAVSVQSPERESSVTRRGSKVPGKRRAPLTSGR
jgi:hypothetical protein